MAVSGQLPIRPIVVTIVSDYTERIWRYQDNCNLVEITLIQPKIIPRGFGGIRTTNTRPKIRSFVDGIIPRGFGGIRTTRRLRP